MRPDPDRVRQVDRHRGCGVHRLFLPRLPQHLLHRRSVRPLQQHPGGQELHPRAQLHDPGRDDTLTRHHLPHPRAALGPQLQPVAGHAGPQLRHDLRFAAHQDQPDRQDTRRVQEEVSVEEDEVHVRYSPGESLPTPTTK